MHEPRASDPVRRWCSRDLAERTNVPRFTVTTSLIPALVKAGVLVRRGRFYFGRAADLDAFLLNQWPLQHGSVQ